MKTTYAAACEAALAVASLGEHAKIARALARFADEEKSECRELRDWCFRFQDSIDEHDRKYAERVQRELDEQLTGRATT